MADSVGADALCLAHRDREVYAEVTGEVVAGQVLRGVRHVVGRADVGLAVGEGDPYGFRIPRRLVAERLEHDGGIFGGRRLGVHVRVLGHDAQLPGVAGGEVVYGAVFAVGVVAAPVIEVLIDDVVRHARSRRVGIAVVVADDAAAGIIGVDGGEGLFACDAVRRQPLGLLIGDDRVGGLFAEVAGLVAGIEAQRGQHVLQLEDFVALAALLKGDGGIEQGRRRGRAAAGRTARGAAGRAVIAAGRTSAL